MSSIVNKTTETPPALIPDDVEFLVGVERSFARTFLIDFIEYNNSAYSTQWFHKKICDTFDGLLKGSLSKVMIFVPPQHGKSLIVSENLPAFALGLNPKMNIVSCSYSADLAQRFNRKVQRLIDTPAYRTLFPETRLNTKSVTNDSKGNWLRNTEVFEIVKYGGSYKAVGIEGPLTGNPVDLGIIDDPIKDSLDAQSITIRNRCWEWYNDVFNTRTHNLSKRILVMTRWHEDDLAGRLLLNEKDWRVISFPALKETNENKDDPREIGNALWPDRHSVEKIHGIRSLSERTFVSLYQQRPSPKEGGAFERKWFKFYGHAGKPPVFDKIIQSWDCTFKDLKTSDFVVGQVWGKIGVQSYLLDMVRGQWSFINTVKQMRLINEKYPNCDGIYVEDKANGTAVINVLQTEIAGIIPVTPTESKESRAAAISYVIEAGNVYFPSEEDWSDKFIEELAVFPNGAHDDMVDATTQALNKLYKGEMMPGMFVIQ